MAQNRFWTDDSGQLTALIPIFDMPTSSSEATEDLRQHILKQKRRCSMEMRTSMDSPDTDGLVALIKAAKSQLLASDDTDKLVRTMKCVKLEIQADYTTGKWPDE